ncbi:MAG: glycosyltransferase family 2 protein [Anaerolineae bacterium]|nr:glycosyltransferase family 2 protein [Anaerolineae bacterium]
MRALVCASFRIPIPGTIRAMIDLSIVIVSWNVRGYLAACLDSISASLAARPVSAEIIVVDSASSDDAVDLLRERYPQVRVLPQRENIGFTRGNNLGLAAAAGRFVLLLNPDTEITGDALGRMVAYLDANPAVGIVGPHTLNTDGSHQSTRRRFPTLLTAIFESTWLQPLAPRRILDRYYVRDAPDEATADVDWVQGSALMVRREVIAQIGGLDDGYVMFSEEMDFCRRARDAGWRVVYLGGARIIHHGGKSTDQAVASRHIYFQQSKLRYFRKFHGALPAALLRMILISLYVYQMALEAAKGALGHKRRMRGERVRVYWQVVRALVRPGARVQGA